MTRTAAPKVPGEISAPAEDQNDQDTAPDAQEATTAADPVTVERTTLEDLLATVAELKKEVKTLKAAKPAVVSKSRAPVAELPDADSIDPNTLKSPVLTKQGWLVPDTFGSNPNAPKAL